MKSSELEYELPCQFDPKTKQWLFDETITWDEVSEGGLGPRPGAKAEPVPSVALGYESADGEMT